MEKTKNGKSIIIIIIIIIVSGRKGTEWKWENVILLHGKETKMERARKTIDYVARARIWAAAGCYLLWIRWFSWVYVRLFLRSLLRSATNRFFQRGSLWFRFFLRKWSFLGIVRNFYFINILRVVLLMICITMAAKRSVRLLIFACQTENVRILSICTWNFTSKIWANRCFRIRIQLWIGTASFASLAGLCFSELP